MRYFCIALVGIVFFSGCVQPEPKPQEPLQVKDVNKSVSQEVEVQGIEETFVPTLDSKDKAPQDKASEEVTVIANVFSDELYFEKDKEGVDLHQLVIKYLDAQAWEKKALRAIYKKHKKIWSQKQSDALWRIIEKNHYFGLCADGKYWDNLQFEESEPERDILHSMVLIRYLNNLSNGCPQWIESKGKVQDENTQEHINTQEILSLLPHGVLVDKLIMVYVSKSKTFKSMIDNHHESLSLDKKEEEILAERLAIEAYKREEKTPKYHKRK